MRAHLLALLISTITLHPRALFAEDSSQRLGVILPLSGEFAVLGDACRKGVELAISELKTEDIPLTAKFEDSPSASATATLTAYNKLHHDLGISVFLGFVSAEELEAVRAPSAKDGSALVAIGTPKNRPSNALVIWMSPFVEAQQLAHEMAPKFKRVAILSADQQWESDVSDAFTTEFVKLGGEIALRLNLPYSTKDVSSSLLKIKRANPDAIIIPPYSLFSAYAKALHKLNIKIPVYAVEIDQSAIDDAGSAAEGFFVIRPADSHDAFKQKYAQAYSGKSADIPSSQCFDGTKIVGAAIQHGARSGNDFIRYFSALSHYAGASGPIRFTGNDTIFDTEILQVSGGQLRRLHTVLAPAPLAK